MMSDMGYALYEAHKLEMVLREKACRRKGATEKSLAEKREKSVRRKGRK